MTIRPITLPLAHAHGVITIEMGVVFASKWAWLQKVLHASVPLEPSFRKSWIHHCSKILMAMGDIAMAREGGGWVYVL